MKTAVVAHAGKTLGEGLPELRRVLARAGVEEPLWYEVRRAKKASKQVQRASLAVLPAGTANLFATNLGIPRDIEQAVAVGLRGDRRRLDVGRFKKERFAVMAGAGAAMIRDADDLKERMGRTAYLWSGSRNLRGAAFGAEIEVDGSDWYEGTATCILLGNLGDVFGGVKVFPDARPDDGMLELGVVTAEGLLQWTRTLARAALGDPNRSPFVQTTKAKSVKVDLDREVRYELDGGDRRKVRSFKAKVEAGALSVCVPRRRGDGT